MAKLDSMLEIGHAKRPLSLQVPITAFLLTIMVVAVVGYIIFDTSRDLALESSKRYLHDKNEQAKIVIALLYKENSEQIKLISQLPPLQRIAAKLFDNPQAEISSEISDFEEEAINILKTRNIYNSIKYVHLGENRDLISIVKKSNRVITLTGSELKDYEIVPFAEQMKTLVKGKEMFSNIKQNSFTANKTNSRLIFDLAIPVWLDTTNKPVGLIIVEVNFDRFTQLLHSIVLSDIHLYLANENGIIFYDSNLEGQDIVFNTGDGRLSLQNKFPQLSDLDLNVSESTIINTQIPDKKNELIYGIYQIYQNNQYGQSQVFKWFILPSESRLFQALKHIKNRTLVISICMAFIALFLSLIAARRITKPLNQMINAIQSDEINSYEVLEVLPVNAQDELGVLARSFHNMQVIRNQKNRQIKEHQFALDQHCIVSATDVTGKILFFNSKFEEISGYSKGELIGQDHRILNSGLHDSMFFKQMYSDLAQGKVWKKEICNKNKNGRLYWVDTTVVPLMGDDNKPYQYISIRTDITQSKTAIEKLKESEERFEMSRSVSNDGIWDWSIITNRIFFDNHYYTMAGYEVNEFPSNFGEWELRVHPDDLSGAEYILNEYLSGKVSKYDVEFRFLRKNKSYMWIRAKGKIVSLDKQGNPTRMVGTHQDITDKKESENRIIEEKNRAERAVHSKTEFFASMSHEIRTPMNGVLGMLALMMRTELNKQQKHYATLARSSADSLLAIIDDILDLSKIEVGKIELEILDFNLREQLGIFAEAMAYRAQDKGLEMVLDVTGIEHSMVKGDPGRLRQILSNLVGNAIKFTKSGEITIKAKLKKLNEENWILHCEITDTGMGIPEDKVAGLFDSYSQVDSSTTRKFGGTGLGLAIVKQLCKLMQGQIEVKSQLGIGSQFIFDVCLGVSELSKLVAPEQDVKGKTILLVDDNPTNLEVLAGQLKHWGVSTVSANSGMQALDILRQKQSQKENYFDVAILDMGMPEMDGAQLGTMIRANSDYDDLKLVMMTSMAGSGDISKFKNIGFSAYFPKPATTSDLFHALQVLAEDGKTLAQLDGMVTNYNISNMTSTNQFSNAQILLVEDNPINQEVAVGILEDMGASVEIAENGVLAIEKLMEQNSDFGLILMDCQMPIMDGYEATRAIRSQKYNIKDSAIPIIAMTANALKGDRQKCLDAGMDDYLSKPVDPNALEEMLRHWLPKNQQDHHLHSSNNRSRTEREDRTVYISNYTESKLLEKETKRSEEVEVEKAEVNQVVVDEVVNEENEELMQRSIWDRKSLMERIRNNEKLSKKLILLFLSDLPKISDDLKMSVKVGDLEQIAAHSHRIKGSSANLSAIGVSEIATAIEKSAQMGDLGEVKNLIGKYEYQVSLLLIRLKDEVEVK